MSGTEKASLIYKSTLSKEENGTDEVSVRALKGLGIWPCQIIQELLRTVKPLSSSISPVKGLLWGCILISSLGYLHTVKQFALPCTIWANLQRDGKLSNKVLRQWRIQVASFSPSDQFSCHNNVCMRPKFVWLLMPNTSESNVFWSFSGPCWLMQNAPNPTTANTCCLSNSGLELG